ncbi:hypothetical protein LAZ67_X000351 [Cordylochernes scorpioides]|uniref:Transposase n=1 Tax=Cordylochernes scorpioides TaxID=51811 RepID=A0ABY6LU41_9ARAC|nr:hypothetical protein LAZ67_X000351 [Cordylochernes scorpioides]
MEAPLKECTTLEQRAVIRFLNAEGIQTSQICQRMINIYGESCLSQKNIYKWVNEFKSGRITCSDIERPGRPSVTATPSTINAVENLILEDRKISIFTIADNLHISYGTVHTIINEQLQFRKICCRWIPHFLNLDQKLNRIRVSKALLKRYEEEGDHFLDQIVTRDESWCYNYDPSTKRASMEWKRGDSPRPKKIRSQRSAGKVLLTIFWDVDGPICLDFLSSRQRMNSDLYCDILVNKLKPGIRNKRRGKLSKGVLFLHDNARPHTSCKTVSTIIKLGFEVLEHPAYSPDLAPSDYFLFGLLKRKSSSFMLMTVGFSIDIEEYALDRPMMESIGWENTTTTKKNDILGRTFAMDQDIPDYDMDSDDEQWFDEQSKKINITAYKFEDIMDRLEKSSGQQDCTTLEQRAVIRFLNAEGIQTSQICQRMKNIYGFEVLEHPAYSPDLAPSDYFLFGLLKKELKGKRFDSDEDVQKVVQDFFHTLPKSAYKEGIYKLPERWRRCIESQVLSQFPGVPCPIHTWITALVPDRLIAAVHHAVILQLPMITNQQPLIPQVKTERRDGSTSNNPYVAFRRRSERMQTRKKIRKDKPQNDTAIYSRIEKNDETSYEKMLKLKRDLHNASYHCGDFNGQMLAEVMVLKTQHQVAPPLLVRITKHPVVNKQEKIRHVKRIKCADAFRMLTVAYGEATLDRSNVYRLYKMFSEGREDVNDEERAGRPSTSTTDEKINEVEKMILANRRITVREVAEDLNISIGSCHSIFINDLGMRRVAAKFVPKLLNCDQKQHRMNIANEMLDSVRDYPNLLQRVITGDEAWVYGYDVETKAQPSQWKLPHEPRPKKARQVRSNVKVLLTVFFDCRGVVHQCIAQFAGSNPPETPGFVEEQKLAFAPR